MRQRKTGLWIGAVAAVGIGVACFVLLQPHPTHKIKKMPLAMQNDNIPKPSEADKLYASSPKVAKEKYQAFVKKYTASHDPKVQDQVGTARLKVGFLAAHQRNWTEARTAFLAADKQTKGTDQTGDFGTVNEQGAYEAIVCLDAAGKKEEAKKQYIDFIKNRPLSALCMACYRRLKRLNGGKTTEELDALIQSATTKQDANAKFESSVCGPRTLAHLCDLGVIKPGNQPHDYKAIAKLCHTKDTGTSIAGMLDGLKALGVQATAYKVNRQDLAKLKTPAILLWGDHYLTLVAVKDRAVRVFDTLTHTEHDLTIPNVDDPDFFVNAILLNNSI